MRTKLECLECGKRFFSASLDPRCPRCHGVDVDLAPAPDEEFNQHAYNAAGEL